MNIIGHPVEFEVSKTSSPKPLTDEEISVLWHEAQQQPFRFARLLEKRFYETQNHNPQ